MVPVPENGQLTPEMIATGRKLMQAKAASKFNGSLAPGSLTGTQSQALTQVVDKKVKRRTLDGALDPTVSQQSEQSGTRGASGGHSQTLQNSKSSSAETVTARTHAQVEPHTQTKPQAQPGVEPKPVPETQGKTQSNAQDLTGQAGIKASFTPVQDPQVPATPTGSSAAFDGSQFAPTGARTSIAREEHASAHSPLKPSAEPIRKTGMAIPFPPKAEPIQSELSAESAESVQPSWMSSNNEETSETASFSATAGASESQKKARRTGVKLSRKTLILVAAAILIALAVLVLVLQLGKSENAEGQSADYKSLGLKESFDCSALGAEVMTLSQSTPGEIPIDDLENPKMTKDMRGSFELPEKSGEFVDAFECEADAQYPDGESQLIKYNISADKNKKFWTKYDQRN